MFLKFAFNVIGDFSNFHKCPIEKSLLVHMKNVSFDFVKDFYTPMSVLPSGHFRLDFSLKEHNQTFLFVRSYFQITNYQLK